MNRRDALKGLLALPATVMAAQLGAPEYMAEEIRDELLRDTRRTVVGFSDVEIYQPKPVWASIGATAEVWADYVAETVGLQRHDARVKSTTYRMAREMDARLRKAKVEEDSPIIVETPRVQNIYTDRFGDRQFELASGVEEKTGLFGIKQVRVGFLKPKSIVDQNGRSFE